jgi:aromatic ring-opening dioxygenase catalytic subunit (LigB family)
MNGSSEQTALPTLYIPHGGGPCFFMDWTMGPSDTWEKMAAWLRQLAASLGTVPKAIVVISGHWEEDSFTVTGNPNPPLIYDYYGFPEHTYRLEYGAPGSPALAQRICDLLAQAGLPARVDPARGFDHGVFVPFKLIYPDAEIPMVQLSLKTGLDPAAHIALGRAIAPLREEGVLIVGSGMSYHNMRGFMSRTGGEVSDQFDAWLTATAADADPERRNRKLADWESAPVARAAHPREEHLLPLMVAAGAAETDPGERIFTDRVMGATVSAFEFGAPRT